MSGSLFEDEPAAQAAPAVPAQATPAVPARGGGGPPAAEAAAAAAAAEARAPLAERLRPRTLQEVIGQRHLLGEGKPLRVAFEAHRLHSMILWGPPGVGKTTLARLVATAVEADFIVLSAVLAGVKDIREAVERARAARVGRA